jgi:hypothetical protein
MAGEYWTQKSEPVTHHLYRNTTCAPEVEGLLSILAVKVVQRRPEEVHDKVVYFALLAR